MILLPLAWSYFVPVSLLHFILSGSRQHRRSYPSDEEDEEIEHTLGPQVGDTKEEYSEHSNHSSIYHQ